MAGGATAAPIQKMIGAEAAADRPICGR